MASVGFLWIVLMGESGLSRVGGYRQHSPRPLGMGDGLKYLHVSQVG
jgi:hypothetical protein